MPDILISENIRGTAIDALSQRFDVAFEPDLWRDPQALAERISSVRALIIRNQTQITAELLKLAPNLTAVGRAGVGLDNVDLSACTKAGVLVIFTPEQNAISVAELTMGLIIALARHIPAADADTKHGGWNRQRFYGTELYGKSLGIIGAGKIGFLTAHRARAFGMNILAHDPFVSPDNVYMAEVAAELTSLEDLLQRADVVSCHLPSTPQTAGILNARLLSLMKPSAFFINTSRGEVVNEDDLCTLLRERKIAGAALDVRQKEPPLPGDLESLPNVLLMPHIAALTHEAQDRVNRAICDDITRTLQGLEPLNAVVKLPVRTR